MSTVIRGYTIFRECGPGAAVRGHDWVWSVYQETEPGKFTRVRSFRHRRTARAFIANRLGLPYLQLWPLKQRDLGY
jgi:hypothetical protein